MQLITSVKVRHKFGTEVCYLLAQILEITASEEHINNVSVIPLGSIPKQPSVAKFWKDIHGPMVICGLRDLLLSFNKIPEGLLYLPLSYK